MSKKAAVQRAARVIPHGELFATRFGSQLKFTASSAELDAALRAAYDEGLAAAAETLRSNTLFQGIDECYPTYVMDRMAEVITEMIGKN